MGAKPLELEVNGRPLRLELEPNTTLLQVLREQAGATEVKYGCGEGVCGTCTVLLDGESVSSCLVLALQAQGARVTTLKGLEAELAPLQESFLDHGAVQCGFCIPGMLLVAHELLQREPGADRQAIRAAIAGNLCRCSGYTKIIDAIEACTSMNSETPSKASPPWSAGTPSTPAGGRT